MITGATTVALVGMGGFGLNYVQALLGDGAPHPVQFVAGIDPQPSRCSRIDDIHSRGIGVYPSIEEFRRSEGRADLMVLSTPLHLHAEQTVAALAMGSHVLCEKPLGGHPDQIEQMIGARERFSLSRAEQGNSPLQVAIGYQWSFSEPVLRLKRDIMRGRWGKPLRLRSKVYWPRGPQYYARNSWAGRVRDEQGRWILDSPANNACAHYLHNMFFVLGATVDRSAWPITVRAELYRANQIESYDTAVIQCTTNTVAARSVPLLLVVSHATEEQCDPIFSYEFERGTVHHGGEFGEEIVAVATDGPRYSYGRPVSSTSPEKLWDVVRAIRVGEPVSCGPEAAGAQTAAIFAAQQSVDRIADFPPAVVRSNGHRPYVPGLEQILNRCYADFMMPSECAAAWGEAGKWISVDEPAWIVPG